MQPLGVCFMKPVMTFYGEEVQNWLRCHPGHVVTMYQMGELFGAAKLQAAVAYNDIVPICVVVYLYGFCTTHSTQNAQMRGAKNIYSTKATDVARNVNNKQERLDLDLIILITYNCLFLFLSNNFCSVHELIINMLSLQ